MRRLIDIDMALFNDVCSLCPFKGIHKAVVSTHSEEDRLQQATESMSIAKLQDTSPPPLTFSFLRPRPKDPLLLESKSTDVLVTDPVGKLPDVSKGTRLLLSQWEIGSDPEILDPDGSPRILKGRSIENKLKGREGGISSPVQTPPIVQTALLIRTSREMNPGAMAATQPPPLVESQLTSSQVDLATRSRDPDFLDIGTQILPGKHGRRPKGDFKKQKKRMGGF